MPLLILCKMESPKTEINDRNDDDRDHTRDHQSREGAEQGEHEEPIYGIVIREAHRRTVQFQQHDEETEPNDAHINNVQCFSNI